MSQETPGRVRVADEVIASIAATAVREVDGVAGIDTHAGGGLGRVLPRRAGHGGVRVEILEGDTIHLEICIQVEEGTAIATAAAQVQETVAQAVEQMLGLAVTTVDVVVSDVVFSPGPA